MLFRSSGQYVATVGSLTSKSQNEWIDGAIARQKEAYPDMERVLPSLICSTFWPLISMSALQMA